MPLSKLGAAFSPNALGPKIASLRLAMPGIMVSIVIALASSFISEHYGGPVMLFALLFGMAFNFLSEEGPCVAGVNLSARTILRFGVALLGVRITLDQITDLGIGPVITVILAVAVTIGSGWLLARFLKLDRDQGMLSGGAVAICGASAALALSAVMPKHENSERDTILTVVGVTALSTIAMITYPLLATNLNFSDAAAGVFLGGTIHDVAQVVGAGYIVSPQAGDIATFVKLLRVAMLVPAVLFFSYVFREAHVDSGSGKKAPALPSFLVAFVILVAINSAGLIPETIAGGLNDLSRWCLVTAIAALGIKTSFKKLAVVGWRPIAMMVGETLVIAVFVLLALFVGVA
jgi:uncharacterized integral membrane protein (TIGR00698 family)